LAREGADVCVASRQQSRAAAICEAILNKVPGAKLEPAGVSWTADLGNALGDRALVVSAGAAGVTLLPAEVRRDTPSLRLAIDLNAVPPAGIEGVELSDKGVERDGVLCYGALAVGGLKMKLHKAAIARLFQSNDQVLDAEQVYALGAGL